MKLKEKISAGFTGILVLCALVITGLVLKREFSQTDLSPDPRYVENWKEFDLSGQRFGAFDSPVQIVEFFDYQCPYCKEVQASVQVMLKKYPGKVSVIHKHFPLSGHEFAFKAAVAAECAARQNVFKKYHEILFAYQDSLGSFSYTDLAGRIDIPDKISFSKCVTNQETAQIVTDGADIGRKLNITGIPTFVVNGKIVPGALSEEKFDELIQEALLPSDE